MCARAVSLNTKIDSAEKELFTKTCESLGMTPSAAIKVFVRVFNETGGFPFELRKGFPQSPALAEEADTGDDFLPRLNTPRESAPIYASRQVYPTANSQVQASADPMVHSYFSSRTSAPAAQSAPQAAARSASAPAVSPARGTASQAPAASIPRVPEASRPAAAVPSVSAAPAAKDPDDTAVLNRMELDAMMATVYDNAAAQDGTDTLSDIDEPYGGFDQLSRNEMLDAIAPVQRSFLDR